MWRNATKTLLLTAGICIIALLTGEPVFSEPRYDLHNDLVAHGAIEYEGSIDNVIVGQEDQVRRVIIDDRTFVLTDDCILRNRYGTLVPIEYFQVHMSVGYFLVDETQITKLWHVVDTASEGNQEQPVEVTPDAQGTGDGAIRLENGVWKN